MIGSACADKGETKIMKITDFEKPTKHPYSMLEKYQNAHEKEEILAYMLNRSIEQGSFEPIKLKYEHPTMVSDGLLEEKGEKVYKLTKKSIGLLYSIYGKEVE